VDGTAIGYREYGSGPGLILVHGGMKAAQHFGKLAGALGNDFRVYAPDRRGRA
jgi:pimeloyl-ACP methyl ester carboxylesterase